MRQIAGPNAGAPLCLTVGRADINGNVNALALHVAGDGCFVIAGHCAAAARHLVSAYLDRQAVAVDALAGDRPSLHAMACRRPDP